jgi:membrane-bound lytic murein transglycosylase D
MNRNYWKKLLRRDLPIIAFGAVVAAGTVTRENESFTPTQPVSAVESQLSYLADAKPAEAPKPFAKTAIGTTAIADIDHKFVSRWVSTFTGARKNDLETTLGRMEPYTAMIEKKLDERGMPRELVYLALIESGGDAKAKSPVGARGLWQFMAPTARQYGLSSSERLDPVKSTDAALEYLSDLHARFGSWYLAAAAYNTGQGRVSKVLKQVTGKSKGTDEDFYKIAGRLPKETRDYVPKLVAVARIAKEPGKYGLAE